MLVFNTFTAAIISTDIPYSSKISNIVSRLTESKALLKSTKMRAAVLLQNLISSNILRNVRICPRVGRPGRKPFWFLHGKGSTSAQIQFRRSLL